MAENRATLGVSQEFYTPLQILQKFPRGEIATRETSCMLTDIAEECLQLWREIVRTKVRPVDAAEEANHFVYPFQSPRSWRVP